MRRRRLYRRLRLAGVVVSCLVVVGIYAWGIRDGNATVVTAATALLVFALGELRRWQLAAQQDRWGRIAEEYERFLALIRGDIPDEEPDRAEALAEREEAMVEFGNRLMLWGSARVIRAWVHMRRTASPEMSGSESSDNLGRLVVAIRKEFGHTDLTLDERDLFRIMFGDELETLLAQELNV